MAVAEYLASSFRYLLSSGVTDVATIISDFRSETVTNGSPAWTEPATALFQSPADALGQWFDVLLTAISTTNLECRVRNWVGTTITTRRMYIDGAGTNVLIFSGEKHFHIVSQRATWEHLGGGMLDYTPEVQNVHTDKVFFHGHRDNTNNIDSQGVWNNCQCLYTGSSAGGGRVLGLSLENSGGTRFDLATAGGSYLSKPIEYFKDNSGTGGCVRLGQAYQRQLLHYGLSGDIDIPLDIGVVGTFFCLGMIDSSLRYQMGIRKA